MELNGADIQTSRNMVIIRKGNELTLVNTVRLNAQELKTLDSLGKVVHIVRIGAFHGRDDAFYCHQYPNAQLLTLEGTTYESGLTSHQDLTPQGEIPFTGCSLFVFDTSTLPEGVLHIDREGGILISYDSIQNITAIDEFYNLETAQSYRDQGLVRSANISSTWLGATHTRACDFYRLLGMKPFRHLLTAHGEPLLNNAFERVAQSIRHVFS